MRFIVFILILLLQTLPIFAQESSFVYDDKSVRDPFWPLINGSGSIINYDSDYTIADLTLEGVMLGSTGQDHLAIINGKVLKINDKLGLFVIEKIYADYVLLKKGEQEFTLRLKKGE